MCARTSQLAELGGTRLNDVKGSIPTCIRCELALPLSFLRETCGDYCTDKGEICENRSAAMFSVTHAVANQAEWPIRQLAHLLARQNPPRFGDAAGQQYGVILRDLIMKP
jgi:hypothetical protein